MRECIWKDPESGNDLSSLPSKGEKIGLNGTGETKLSGESSIDRCRKTKVKLKATVDCLNREKRILKESKEIN